MIFLFVLLNKGIFKDYNNLDQVILYLATGAAVPQLWYIPYIIITFLFFPILKKIDKNTGLLVIILSILSILSIFIQRAPSNLNIIQLVVYYLPAYLFGSLVSKNKIFINNKAFYISVFMTACILFYQNKHPNIYVSSFFEYNGIDFLFIQKAFLCVLLLNVVKKYLYRENIFLKPIANYSFGIFFVHFPLLMIFTKINDFLKIQEGFLSFLVLSILVFFLSIIIVKLVKILFKDKSKYLIGV